MTPPPQHQPPVMPGYPAQPPQGDWTPPAPKKRGPLPWLIGGLIVLVLAVGGLTAALASGVGKPKTSTTTAPPLPQDRCGGGICQTDPVTATTTPAATYTPKAGDFALRAKIIEKHCFGSAGCNVTVEPELSYSGSSPLDTDVTWRLIYEITGDEDGPQVGNLTVTGTDYEGQREHLSTASSKTKITIKVTSVEQQD